LTQENILQPPEHQQIALRVHGHLPLPTPVDDYGQMVEYFRNARNCAASQPGEVRLTARMVNCKTGLTSRMARSLGGFVMNSLVGNGSCAKNDEEGNAFHAEVDVGVRGFHGRVASMREP
jgi:hypothetical protein